MNGLLVLLGIELGEAIVSGGLGAPSGGGGPPPPMPTNGPFKLRSKTPRRKKLRLKAVVG